MKICGLLRGITPHPTMRPHVAYYQIITHPFPAHVLEFQRSFPRQEINGNLYCALEIGTICTVNVGEIDPQIANI